MRCFADMKKCHDRFCLKAFDHCTIMIVTITQQRKDSNVFPQLIPLSHSLSLSLFLMSNTLSDRQGHLSACRDNAEVHPCFRPTPIAACPRKESLDQLSNQL